MNALTKPGGSSGTGLIPQNMDQAMRLAEMMARGKMMPEHLRNPGDALMVVEQAMRWNMSPFAVAQATHSIKGKLFFAGTLVAAAVENSGAIEGLIDYQFSGEGAGRKVTVIARRRGETEPRTVEVALKDAQTDNQIWKRQPDQQLAYHGARVWARRWTPGVMLGVYAPEEWREPAQDTFAGTTIDAKPYTAGDAIGDEIPDRIMQPRPEPKKQTVTDWLDALEADLKDALQAPSPHTAVDAIVARPDVQKALDRLQNGARARLNAMIDDARRATEVEEPAEPAEDDIFPGDRP